MSFPTWTNALKIPVDEDIPWHHRPNPLRRTSTNPDDWEWRRDRRVTYEAVIDMAARYQRDFVQFLDAERIEDPVLRFYHGAQERPGWVTYLGTWIIDDINIKHTKQGGKTIVSVTLLNTSDYQYEWHSRSDDEYDE
jgi:hypothetical protein